MFYFYSYVDTIAQQFIVYQTKSLDESFNKLSSFEFWQKIGEIQNLQGSPEFGDLVKLVNVCFSLSHGNADPERGFSENKYILKNLYEP